MALKSPRANWYFNAAVLLESGHGVAKALRVAGKSSSGNLGKSIERMVAKLQDGDTVAQCMEAEAQTFSALERTLVRYGEQAGRLPEAFRHLSDWYDVIAGMRRKAILGLLLPVLVWHVAALVIPIPAAVGPSGGGVSGYVMSVLGYLGLFYVPAAVAFFVWRWVRGRAGDGEGVPGLGLVLKVPLVGAAIRDSGLCIFTRVFHMLNDAGVPVQDCVRAALRCIRGNPVYAWVSGTQTAVDNHEPVSEGFSADVPARVHAVWLSAEESGSFHSSLSKLADQLWDDAKAAFYMALSGALFAAYIGMMIFMAVAILSSAVGTIIPVIDDI